MKCHTCILYNVLSGWKLTVLSGTAYHSHNIYFSLDELKVEKSAYNKELNYFYMYIHDIFEQHSKSY